MLMQCASKNFPITKWFCDFFLCSESVKCDLDTHWSFVMCMCIVWFDHCNAHSGFSDATEENKALKWFFLTFSWIVIGCGIAPFGRRGLSPPKHEHFGLEFCPQGPQMAIQRGTLNFRSHVLLHWDPKNIEKTLPEAQRTHNLSYLYS